LCRRDREEAGDVSDESNEALVESEVQEVADALRDPALHITVALRDGGTARARVLQRDATYITFECVDPTPVLTPSIVQVRDEHVTWNAGWSWKASQALEAMMRLRET
jgi:hypothetical protein